jgi:hypothetical protein
MPSVSLPSILTMMSPGLRPARAAGVPSIGETIFGWLSSCVISAPMPANSPSLSSSRS